MKLRPATRADVRQFYGDHPPGKSLRALVAEHDGKLMGIGGLCYDNAGGIGVFSIMRPGMEKFPVTRARAAVLLARMARDCHATAVADMQIEGSADLLKRLGFDEIGTTEEGRVFGWLKPQQ